MSVISSSLDVGKVTQKLVFNFQIRWCKLGASVPLHQKRAWRFHKEFWRNHVICLSPWQTVWWLLPSWPWPGPWAWLKTSQPCRGRERRTGRVRCTEKHKKLNHPRISDLRAQLATSSSLPWLEDSLTPTRLSDKTFVMEPLKLAMKGSVVHFSRQPTLCQGSGWMTIVIT